MMSKDITLIADSSVDTSHQRMCLSFPNWKSSIKAAPDEEVDYDKQYWADNAAQILWSGPASPQLPVRSLTKASQALWTHKDNQAELDLGHGSAAPASVSTTVKDTGG